jgi:gamma-glutamyltranspeptidase
MFRAQGFHGAVASAHPLATEAGLEVLRQGGGAADAAVAVNAVLNVTQPDACGVGGDLFALYYEAATGRVVALNSSGRSPRAARREDLASRFASIPPRSAYAVTVPGCVAGWWALHERFGRLPWPSLFRRAVDVARDGFPLTARVAASLRAMEREGWPNDPHARALFFQEAPREGLRLRLPDLAVTLDRIAAEGPDAFYRGELGRAIARRVTSLGHPLSAEDLAEHDVRWDEPLALGYRDVEILTTPPNSQGVTALLMLRTLSAARPEAFDGPLDPRWIDLVVDAKRSAYRFRDEFVTDPEAMVPGIVAAALRGAAQAQGGWGRAPSPDGDTTAFSVVDGQGDVAVVIQSLFKGFGSGVVVPGTGIVLHNRGAYFRLEPGHANTFAGGKRTLHTLMATLVRQAGRPLLAFSTMGGDGQPQTTVQVLTAHLDFGLTLEAAVDLPRWRHGHGLADAAAEALFVEARLPEAARALLGAMGHDVRVLDAYAHDMGHAQAIRVEGDGLRTAAADPRGDGVALAF